jgi:hypothetical protein
LTSALEKDESTNKQLKEVKKKVAKDNNGKLNYFQNFCDPPQMLPLKKIKLSLFKLSAVSSAYV